MKKIISIIFAVCFTGFLFGAYFGSDGVGGLPDQAGNGGKYLYTNGSVGTWASVSATVNASTSNYATTAGVANYATTAGTASAADSAVSALTALLAGVATTANYATTSSYSITSNFATTANAISFSVITPNYFLPVTLNSTFWISSGLTLNNLSTANALDGQMPKFTASSGRVDWATPASGGGGSSETREYLFDWGSFDNIISANDIPYGSVAPATIASGNSHISCRVFDDTITSSVLATVFIPSYATTVTFGYYGSAKTGVSGKEVDWVLNFRVLANGLPGGWSVDKKLGSQLADGSANVSENKMTLASLGMTAGNYYQLELSRDVKTPAGNNVVGNYQLVLWRIKFS